MCCEKSYRSGAQVWDLWPTSPILLIEWEMSRLDEEFERLIDQCIKTVLLSKRSLFIRIYDL